MGERAGLALRRAPYAWLVAMLAVHWLLMSVASRLSGVADEADEPSVGLTVGVVGFVVCGVVSSLVLVPRFVVPALRRRGSDGQAAMVAWAAAAAPFALTWAGALAGSHRSVLVLGFFASAGLLVIVARDLHRDTPPGQT